MKKKGQKIPNIEIGLREIGSLKLKVLKIVNCF